MKYLDTYNRIGLKDEKSVFEYMIDNFKESIFTWEFFVDFDKVKKNASYIEKELNLLNVLIGKNDLDKEFINLVSEYPKIRRVLPILLAIRNNKLKELNIIDDVDELVSENKNHLFNPKIELTSELKKDLISFFNDSGLKNIFENKEVKNLVDYCFGIEVGMDTNARKNRTGTSMENIVEKIIKKFSDDNGVDYIAQATKSKIKEKWDLDIELDKTNRQFDFAVFNKSNKKLFLIETNFYGGQGSKLKATAGEYHSLGEFLKSKDLELIWITDGIGWHSAKKPLYETFSKNKYVFNLELLKKGVLKEVILKN